ncbi:MAG: hypothetical protein M5R40_02940 [Anaerolineae bacterium]|nr:hypothetical protein [Anaerolineae bacterium]
MVLRDPHMGESMTQETLEDILAAHVDALLHGDDPTGALVAVYAAARDLLYLARRLYAVMVPVEPNARFVRQLKRELVGKPAGVALFAPRTWLRAPVQVPASVKLVGALGASRLEPGCRSSRCAPTWRACWRGARPPSRSPRTSPSTASALRPLRPRLL